MVLVLNLFLLGFLSVLFFKTSLTQLLVIFCVPYFLSFMGQKISSVVSIGKEKSLLMTCFFIGLLTYTLWFLGAFFLIPLNALTICFIVICFIIALTLLDKNDFSYSITKGHQLFYASLIFLLILSINNHLYWGEKPMDFSLLSYFRRLEGFPITDPWASGSTLHYYYFGFFMWGMLGKLFNIQGEFLYFYSLAMTFALFLTGLNEIFGKKGWWKSALITFGAPLGWSFYTKGLGFNSFWNLTRSPGTALFHEYPFWSLMWKDLHPHVIGVIFLLLNFFLYERFKKDASKRNTILLSLGATFSVATNTWDALFFCFYVLIDILFDRFKFNRRYLLVGLLTLFFATPFLAELSSGKKLILGFQLLNLKVFALNIGLFGLWFIVLRSKRVELFKFIILTLLLNSIVIMDKGNTYFKLQTALFIIMGVVALRNIKKVPYFVLCYSLLGGFYTYLSGSSIMQGSGISKGIGLAHKRPHQVIEWVNDEVKGTPVVLEAPGSPYKYKTSTFSSFTGLPTVLGWEHHLLQRGKRWSEIQRRKKDIDTIFRTKDLVLQNSLLDKYGVKYIFLGEYERKRYGKIALSKFLRQQSTFKVVFIGHNGILLKYF